MAERLHWLEAPTTLTATPDSRATQRLDWLEPRQSAPVLDDGMGDLDSILGRIGGGGTDVDSIVGGGGPPGGTSTGSFGIIGNPAGRLAEFFEMFHGGTTSERWNMGIPLSAGLGGRGPGVFGIETKPKQDQGNPPPTAQESFESLVEDTNELVMKRLNTALAIEQSYKKIAGYLADAASAKKVGATMVAADALRFAKQEEINLTALEKKMDSLFRSGSWGGWGRLGPSHDEQAESALDQAWWDVVHDEPGSFQPRGPDPIENADSRGPVASLVSSTDTDGTSTREIPFHFVPEIHDVTRPFDGDSRHQGSALSQQVLARWLGLLDPPRDT